MKAKMYAHVDDHGAIKVLLLNGDISFRSKSPNVSNIPNPNLPVHPLVTNQQTPNMNIHSYMNPAQYPQYNQIPSFNNFPQNPYGTSSFSYQTQPISNNCLRL